MRAAWTSRTWRGSSACSSTTAPPPWCSASSRPTRVKEQGVYAATLTIGGLIERGDIHRAMVEQGTSLPTLDPDEIADRVWRMDVPRDEAEAVFDALTPAA
ncbi:hypothetical protein GCM10023320_07250 [Pseudonocardia adelaidensis]|uniref:Uncharacterized protein n=1 Tax=Pseudonocardia adelaidensis TaxID=648754 RepID=A0ABP9ND48_9PSEU